MEKTCIECGDKKPLKDFGKRAINKKDGLDNKCKDCSNRYQRRRFHDNIEESRTYKRNWHRSKRMIKVKTQEKIRPLPYDPNKNMFEYIPLGDGWLKECYSPVGMRIELEIILFNSNGSELKYPKYVVVGYMNDKEFFESKPVSRTESRKIALQTSYGEDIA